MGGLKTLACQVHWATRGRGHSPGAVREAEAPAAGGKLPRREVAANLDAGVIADVEGLKRRAGSDEQDRTLRDRTNPALQRGWSSYALTPDLSNEH